MALDLNMLKKIREETGAGVADVKNAIEQAKASKNADFDKVIKEARAILKQQGFNKATTKAGREVKAGIIETYSHQGKVGVLIELLCETDFVAKTEDFKNLAHELSLQVASMKPSSVGELLNQEYIRDPSTTIEQLIKSVISKVGENIQIGRFERIALGE